MLTLNLLVLFITATSTYILAGIWYSPALFGKIWHRESRDSRPYVQTRPWNILLSGFLFSAIGVVAFSKILGPYPYFGEAIGLGLYVGFFFLASSFGLHYQITNDSLKLWLIDGGFRVVQFGVFGWLLTWLGKGFDLFPKIQTETLPPSEILYWGGFRNFPAILAAAIAGLLLTKLWYTPYLFGKIWLRADAGRQQLRKGQPWRIFGLGFLFSTLSAAAFAKWLGPFPSLPYALQQGLGVGVCFAGFGTAINYLCAGQNWKLYWIDGGAQAARFLLYALILGLWK